MADKPVARELTAEEQEWELESGLADDFDGTIQGAHFGTKDDYNNAVIAGGDSSGSIMLLLPFVDAEGNAIAEQGYSIGKGWEADENGAEISHPTRNNVVESTLYGQFQKTVTKDLGVVMAGRGSPRKAATWDGMTFHMMLKEHATVGGANKKGLMPTEFLENGLPTGEEVPAAVKAPPARTAPLAAARPAARAPAAPGAVRASVAEAQKLVNTSVDWKTFMQKATKVNIIATDDALMAQVTDDSDTGFFKMHKGK